MGFFLSVHDKSIYMSSKYKEVPNTSRSNKGKEDYSLDDVTPNHLTSWKKVGETVEKHK